MRVFISFSGENGLHVATALRDWLPMTLQAVEPFLSGDIEKGGQWPEQVNRALGESDAGIVCVTRDSLDAPWLLYESGALSRVGLGRVCTFLWDVNKVDVAPPLGFFQATATEKEDVGRLIRTLNNCVRDANRLAVDDARLMELFEHTWPTLMAKLQRSERLETTAKRKDRELLEEAVALLRGLTVPATRRDRREFLLLLRSEYEANIPALVRHLLNHPRVLSVGPFRKSPINSFELIFEMPADAGFHVSVSELGLVQFGVHPGDINPWGPGPFDFPKNYTIG